VRYLLYEVCSSLHVQISFFLPSTNHRGTCRKAGVGKGAAVGAGVGGGIGAGSEVITKGDQVKVPSETLLDFTLQQELSIPTHRGS
jgi:hypothetical protein